MNEVAARIPNKWYAVGIQLNLTDAELQALRVSNPHGDITEIFGRVFTIWQENKTREYSWATMIEVLKTPSVHQPRLAEDLARILRKSSSN